MHYSRTWPGGKKTSVISKERVVAVAGGLRTLRLKGVSEEWLGHSSQGTPSPQRPQTTAISSIL